MKSQIHLRFFSISILIIFIFLSAGKTPEEVVKKYLQKVKSPPEEVSASLLSTLLHTLVLDINNGKVYTVRFFPFLLSSLS